MLPDHHFSESYSSDRDDIAENLYLPAMSEAVSYDRISGFFSSTVLMVAFPALRQFVNGNNGKIRLLCSPRLSEADAAGMLLGYQARNDEELARQLKSELDRMLADTRVGGWARLLTALIANETIDVQLATVNGRSSASSRRMFHDKVGLFRDRHGHQVGFRGTFNETFLGLSRDGNVESVDVWTSWEDGKDVRRLDEATGRFEALWAGEEPGVRVIQLPDSTIEYIRQVAEGVDSDELMVELAAAEQQLAKDPWELGDRGLRDHQQAAVEAWRANGRLGLLDHATGSGKTVTGMFCIREAQELGLVPVVIVPSTLLQDQWTAEIKKTLGSKVLQCGGGNTAWRNNVLSTALQAGGNRVVVAVAATAASDEFRRQATSHSESVLLVADEAHRLGSGRYSQILTDIPARARLGLSATPARAGDPHGTDVLNSYFSGVVHEYGIREALRDGVLVRYEYDAEFVELTDDEQDRFDDLTKKIRRQAAIASSDNASAHARDRLKRLLIDRSRVIKNATAKPPKAAEILQARHRDGDRWLVYCDNKKQVEDVRQCLSGADLRSWEYFRGMDGDPERTLKAFEVTGGVVVSIRCLDEGVDIPAADHALLLASSRNPREHIQRRGRVLRRAPWKTMATLVDVLALPRTINPDDDAVGATVGEVARAVEFATWSESPATTARLQQKWVELGLELNDLPSASREGFETDDDEEAE